MEPDICHGDTVVIDRDAVPEVGKLVVFERDEQVMVKRLVRRGNERYLEALDGTSIKVDGAVRIEGVVIRSVRAW